MAPCKATSSLHYALASAMHLLLEAASRHNKLSPGFVDDSMMVAVGNDLAEYHEKFKNMMERLRHSFE